MKTLLLVMFLGSGLAMAQQLADPGFDATIANPANTQRHPRVAIDEAHNNFHTKDGLYKPFATLLQNDGYEVVANKSKFDKGGLRNVSVLVIANAMGQLTNDNNDSTPAFTQDECDAVDAWVRAGGALLLIADHAPMGDAAAALAQQLGVKLGRGFAFDSNPSDFADGDPTELVFSEDNHLLGQHAIVMGRNQKERLHRLVAFTGESVAIPKDASALMELSSAAVEFPHRSDLRPAYSEDATRAKAVRDAAAVQWPAKGRAMAIAFKVGKGRVVINGEAAMFTAQVFKEKGSDGVEKIVGKTGMNVPGNDDRQYVLNVLHWLSGLLR